MPAPAGAGTEAKAKRSAEQVELERLRRRNERLEAELAKTRSALDVMGKLHALLEGLSESADTDPKSTRLIEDALGDLAAVTSTSAACDLLGVSRATRYRRRRPPVRGLPAAPAGTAKQTDRDRTPACAGGAPLTRLLRSRSCPGMGPAPR